MKYISVKRMKNNMTVSKPSSSKKLFRTILSLLMALSVLVGCSVMLVGCSPAEEGNDEGKKPNDGGTNNSAQYEGLSDKEYLQKLGYNNLSDLAGTLADAYDAYLGGIGGNAEGGTKADVTLTVGDKVLDLLEDATGGSIDLDFLSTIHMNMTVGAKGQLAQTQMILGLNGKDVATVKVLMDMANYVAYMAIPELNSTFLKLDIEVDADSVTVLQQLPTMLTQLKEALPSGTELETLINRYVQLALAEIDNVERAEAKRELGGLKQDVTVLTAKIYEEDAINMAKAVLTKAKDDAELKKLIEDVAKVMADISDETVDASAIYSDFQEVVQDALTDVEESRENLDAENYFALVFDVDKNHNIVGFSIAMPESERAAVSYTSVTEGGKTAMQLSVDGDGEPMFEMAGNGTIKDGKTTGTYTVKVSGESVLTMDVKDLDDNGGTLTLKPSADVLKDILGDSLPFNELALKITLAEGKLTLNVLSGSDQLLGIAMEVKQADVGNIQLPTDYVDGKDSTAMSEWASKLTFQTIIDNLEKAGVPGELIDMLETTLLG